VQRTLRKWRAIYGVFAQDWLAYKANGIIWILTDMVTAITMPLVWASAAGSGVIEGYNRADFTLYYMAMLLLGSFITSHMMWEISFEIREGQFSTYLVRPISFFQYTFVRNFAWRSIRFMMTLPFFFGLALAYWNLLPGAQIYIGWEFWVAVILGHCVSISIVLMMSMIALFIQEAIAVFELYYIPQLFLSGYMFPISILPEWAQNISKALPFYYTTGVPVELFVGRMDPQHALPLLGMQVLWIVIASTTARMLWRAGLKHYTGIGM
jgi:ABC-2 type transport system permease protein